MQGEAVLGLEAAARSLVRPGTPVLNLVSGVFGKGMGYWLAGWDVADERRRRRLGGDPRQPGGAARELPLDARLEGAVDRRRQVPVHAVGRRPARRRGGVRRGARGRARGVVRAPRARGAGL